MNKEKEARLDKFLWSIRVYKSRGLSASECKKGRVIIDGIPAKPSRTVREGDVIVVKKLPVIYTYKVLDIPKNRVAAKLVPDYSENLTPEEELQKLNLDKLTGTVKREKGTGRPTKRERRILDRLKNNF
jgi:ribosome-associated heat shock protein Hsp15